jgi:hypothetical protein
MFCPKCEILDSILSLVIGNLGLEPHTMPASSCMKADTVGRKGTPAAVTRTPMALEAGRRVNYRSAERGAPLTDVCVRLSPVQQDFHRVRDNRVAGTWSF